MSIEESPPDDPSSHSWNCGGEEKPGGEPDKSANDGEPADGEQPNKENEHHAAQPNALDEQCKRELRGALMARLSRVDTPTAAKCVGLSPRTMATLRERGGGPEYIKVGESRIQYELKELARWKAQQSGECMPQSAAPAEQEPGLESSIVSLKAPEAAAYLGVCIRTLAYWRKRKYGPVWKGKGKMLRYQLADLAAWLKGQTK
jgi:hypothetical protein